MAASPEKKRARRVSKILREMKDKKVASEKRREEEKK